MAFFQFSQRADQSNLAGYPDESGHFVTGVCLLDYCKTAFGTNPVSFAESYYARYPKVSFGHWPPLFYVLEALWYRVLGVTTLNAVLLSGCITAAAALILLIRLRRLHGSWIAWLAVSAFLWLPVVRRSTLLLMSDMLASLFMLLAVLAFCDAWTLGTRRHWIKSGVWTVLAILTKESALTLLVFALIALPLLGGKSFFVRRQLYRIAIGFGLVIGVTLFVYAATGVLHSRDYPQAAVTMLDFWQRLPLVGMFAGGASMAMFLIGGYGAVEVLVLRKFPASTSQVMHARIALMWLAATVISQLAARTLVEDRYFLSAYFPLAMLFAQGLHSVEYAANWISGQRAAGLLAAAGCAVLSIVSTPASKLYDRRTGYAEIAAAIPSDPKMPAILVSSDAVGEGSFVAERLIHDKDRDGLVLRAGKMLSNSDVLGERKLLMKSAEQVREFLNTTPVHFVVLDMNGFIDPGARTHHRLLEDAIRGAPAQFRLMGDFPLYFDGQRRASAVQIYENLGARPNPGGVIRIDMANSLGRSLEIRLKGGNTVSAKPAESSSLPGWLLGLRPGEQNGASSFHLAPDNDGIAAAGGWGRIYVTAPPGHPWQAGRLPDWMTLTSEASGNGDGIITYRVAENGSGEDRRAVIPVGDGTFRVTQPRFPYIYLPFVETYADREAGLRTGGYSYLPQASRWHLEDSPGGSSKATITATGPERGASLIIERHDPPDDDPGATTVYFSGIDVDEGAGYQLSLWLKAEHPSQISVRFGQATAPHNRCGLDQPIDASSSWRKVKVWFLAKGEGCSHDENRFSIEAGQITGKLWLSQISLNRESLASSSAEQRDGEGQTLDQISPGKPPGLLEQTVKPLQPGLLHP